MGLERQYKVWTEGRDPLVSQAKGETRCPLSTPVSYSCVFSGRRTTSQKGSLSQKKDMCKLYLTVFLLLTIVTVEE